MQPLFILVLHSLGNPALAPAFLRHHVFALKNSFPEHIYVYHDTNVKLPDFILKTKFDAIVLDVTFLCARWAGESRFNSLKYDYDFVRTHDAVKVALPQDEYDCSALLDDWMVQWNVQYLFTTLHNHTDIIYPRFRSTGQFRKGYTGYINNALLERRSIPFHERSTDIGYRARKLPAYFGRIGQIKTSIGQAVQTRAKEHGFTTDIEVGDQAMMPGEKWLDFLGNCRFTLGANSGSSLLDPVGKIQQNVRTHLSRHPDATFAELEQMYFPGEDGKHSMTAISPRNIEAAILETCQILVEGDYSGILVPDIDYLPIRMDGSNFAEVAKKMRDHERVNEVVSACKARIINHEALGPSSLAREILELVRGGCSNSGRTSREQAQSVADRYVKTTRHAYSRAWMRASARESAVRWVRKHPRLAARIRSLRGTVS